MKDPLLLLLLVLVGIFLYLAAFKGVIYPCLSLRLSGILQIISLVKRWWKKQGRMRPSSFKEPK